MYPPAKDLSMLGTDPGTRRGARAEIVTVPPCPLTGRRAR